uniref:Uncharacterized protein n=1 Tax=Arundo donax TaxID=35708 RepID=A0A0A9A8H9_ARUDO
MEIFSAAAWNIWLQRNGIIFDGKQPDVNRWRISLKHDLVLLGHRMNATLRQQFLSWIESHL